MKKSYFLLSTILLMSLFFGCIENELCPQITLPEIDNTAPEYTLNIIGPGISQTLSTREGWSGGLLNLLAGGNYRFILSAKDEGGTRLLRIQIPTLITINQLNPENANIIDLSPLSKLLELNNNINAPTSCLIMSGRFTAIDDPNVSGGLEFFASDYGGSDGVRNTMGRSVSINFTEDIERVGFTDF